MACITMLNKMGLSTDPSCTPTLTSKFSFSSPFIRTDVVPPSYMLLINHIYYPLLHSNVSEPTTIHHAALCQKPFLSLQKRSTTPSVFQETFLGPDVQ